VNVRWVVARQAVPSFGFRISSFAVRRLRHDADEPGAVLVERGERDGPLVEVPQRHQTAQVAVAGRVRRQQHDSPGVRRRLMGRGRSVRVSPLVTRHSPLDFQFCADDGFHTRLARRLIERHRGVKPFGVGQRHRRHPLARRRGDDFLRRGHRPEERVVAPASQMNEHRPAGFLVGNEGEDVGLQHL
jgi:hypothetical protein